MDLSIALATTSCLSPTAGGGVPAPQGIAPLAGILTAPRVIVLGASHAALTYGTSSGLLAGVAAHFAAIGFTGTLHSYAVSGSTVAGAAARYAVARQVAAILATEGQNLYLLDSGGNDIAGNTPYPGVAASVDSQLRALVADIRSRGDKVIVLPQTKRLPPWSGLTAGDDLAGKGMLPYNQNIYHPLLAEIEPDWVDGAGVPYVNPYTLADRWPDLLDADGNHGYQLSLHEYELNRIAARAKGLTLAEDRAGTFVIYRFTYNGSLVASHDYAAAGNHVRANPAGGDGNTWIGAARYGGGFDHFITARSSTFTSNSIGPGLSGIGRVADARFHSVDVMGGGVHVQNAATAWVEVADLTPGAQVRISVLSARSAATGTDRRGVFALTGGESAVIDAASNAVSNFHAFAPVTVPPNGVVRLDISVPGGTGYAYLGALGVDFL